MNSPDKKPYYPPQCLTCGCRILEEEEAVQVPSKSLSPIRYMHVRYEDCQKALERKRPKGAKAHVTNLPGLDEMEKW